MLDLPLAFGLNNPTTPLHLSKSIELLISEININLLFHNFTKFRESNSGLKGIYVNGYYMNKETKMNSIKEILTKTNVNTLVIDAKTDNGHVLFDSQSPETDVLKNERIKYKKSL